MTTPLEQLSPAEIGERLRIARETAQVTQAAAAEAADMARTTLVAIEKGQRRIRINELQRLAQCYGTSVNALFRQEAIQVDLLPKFRRLPGSGEAGVADAARLLTELARAEVELEDLLGIQHPRNDPPRRPILPGDVRAQAEQDALEVRQWLGLGLAPVGDIVSLLELQLGVRVFSCKLDPRISGLFAYEDSVGACMMLNANHRRERRAQTAAHELGHLVSMRGEPEVLLDGSPEQTREERYAAAFARGFLTPMRAVTQKFQEITAGSSRLTRRHVIVLAHVFGVSREALVRRLEELGLTRPGTWDWFQAHGGITDQQAREVLGDLASIESAGVGTDRPASLRLGLMATEAWRRELLSEGQLARLLHLDRVALRALVDGFAEEQAEADGALVLGN
ncbi:MAG TPA: XRE family transcriptional regulator [Acetobacteraceae bacterium]|nr:XRE family transcriptional regulator [Acetobacteraceae bacterium]